MRQSAAVLAGLVMFGTLTLEAGERPADGASGRAKAGAFLRFLDHARRTGREVRLPGQPARLVSDSVQPASIRFVRLPDESLLVGLEAVGVRFVESSRGRLHVGRLYPVRIPLSLLAVLDAIPEVERVEAHPQSPWPNIADNAPELAEETPVWITAGANGLPLGGSGVTVGAIDSWIDLFHPSFFRSDGGYFDWVDMDGNGTFDAGADGVDFDHDGTVTGKEILHVLKGAANIDIGDGEPPDLENNGTDFVTDLDWLFLDVNKTGKREYGAKPGFVEGSPAYGEPLFVADDVDRSGKLDPGEKIVLLKTSKLKAIYVPLAGDVYERGKNLIEYDPGNMQDSHATMTVGVLAGNDRLRSRFHGLAPDADILLTDMFSAYKYMTSETETSGAYLEALLWLADHGAQVVMHEYGSPIFEFGDGSSDIEQAIDQVLAGKGVPSCTAAHNYAGYPMHGATSIPPGDVAPFDIDLSVYIDNPEYKEYLTQALYATLRWRVPGVEVEVELVLPDGTKRMLGIETVEEEMENHYLWYGGFELSERGTMMANLALYPKSGYAPDGVPGVFQGAVHSLKVKNPSDKPLPVDLFLADQWGYFVTGELDTYATQEGTISHPATADSAISTAAMRANNDSWGGEVPVGGLSYYSGRGPRIDGVLSLDVAAPSDALAAWHEPKTAYPLYTYAGGTSGALPQVTGIVALLLQADPKFPRDMIRERIQETAISDSFTGKVPNNDWGYGKISAYRVVYGKPPDGNLPPAAEVKSPGSVYLDEVFLLDASPSSDAQDQADALEVRWDVGYDGVFDYPYSKNRELSLGPIGKAGMVSVLAEVRDSGGASTRTLVRVEVLDEMKPAPPEPEPEPEPEPDAHEVAAQDIPGGDAASGDAGADILPAPPRRGGCSAGPPSGLPPSSAGWAFVLVPLALALLRCRRAGLPVGPRPD